MAAGPETVSFLLKDWEEFVEDLYMLTANATDAAETADAFRKANQQDGGGPHPRTRSITTITAGAKTFRRSCNPETKMTGTA